MKIDFSDIKFFTILLAILYIFGLICVFYNCEILCAFLVLLFLIFAILKLKISSKKSIILYLIFFLGFIRAKDSTNIQSILDEVRADDVVLSGQIISSQDISHKNKKIKFFLRADEANIFDKNIENVKAKVLVSLDLASEIEKEIMIVKIFCMVII